MDRRQFLIRAFSAAGQLVLPRFFDRALAFVENHGEPLIEAPTSPDQLLNVRYDDSYVFFLGNPTEGPGTPPTYREWFEDHCQVDPESGAQGHCLEPGELDSPICIEMWAEQWSLKGSPLSEAYEFLSCLDLGPEFGKAGSDAAGELRLVDCPSMCSSYRAAETDDLLSISLLQHRLNELGENTLVNTAEIHKSRWEK